MRLRRSRGVSVSTDEVVDRAWDGLPSAPATATPVIHAPRAGDSVAAPPIAPPRAA